MMSHLLHWWGYRVPVIPFSFFFQVFYIYADITLVIFYSIIDTLLVIQILSIYGAWHVGHK